MKRTLLFVFASVLFSAFVYGQCPTDADWENGDSDTVPTDGTCDSPADDGLVCTPGATVDNLPGTYDILGCATVNFSDTGTITITGTMTIQEDAVVTTAGTLRVHGTLDVYGTLTVSNNFSIRDGGVVTVHPSGIVNVGNNVRVGNNDDATAGTLNLNGVMNVTNEFRINGGGGMDGSGYLTYGSAVIEPAGEPTGSLSGCVDDVGAGSCGDITLPVELIDFNATENDGVVSLNWSTASELNNHGFYVERSLDGYSFDQVAFINGNGSTNDRNNYSYSESIPNPNIYYRLKQEDFDGTTEILGVEFISASLTNQISVYPNPVRDRIRFNGDLTKTFDVWLQDVSGKIYLQAQASTLADTEASFNLALPSLKKGIYFITIRDGIKVSSHKFILE